MIAGPGSGKTYSIVLLTLKMVLPYRSARAQEAGQHFDETVRAIRAGEFNVVTPPEAAICAECDLRRLCHAEGIIGR